MVNIIFLFNSNLIKLFNFIKLKKTYNYKINFIKIVNYVLYLKKIAGCGVRTHAHLCAEDLKSSPLTSRANQLNGKEVESIIYIPYTSLLISYSHTYVGDGFIHGTC